jgi:predicted nucleic acid-binding protein
VTTYVDSSALLKLYVDEADSDDARRFIAADLVIVTAWLALVDAVLHPFLRLKLITPATEEKVLMTSAASSLPVALAI